MVMDNRMVAYLFRFPLVAGVGFEGDGGIDNHPATHNDNIRRFQDRLTWAEVARCVLYQYICCQLR